MNYTQALSPYCTGAGQHENEFSLVLHEVKDVEIGAGVYVSCPACNESALLEGVESLAGYFAPYATDDIFRLHNYGVITWKQAVAIVESREAVELEEGHASCMKCAGVFPAATETHCAWCGAEVVPSAPALFTVMTDSASWASYENKNDALNDRDKRNLQALKDDETMPFYVVSSDSKGNNSEKI